MDYIAFQEDNIWVVQGTKYNLAARAHSVQDIPIAFMNAIHERVLVAEYLGLDPFEGLVKDNHAFIH